MQSEKEKSAHEAYKKFLDIMLYDVPLKQLDDLVVNDVTGYGTTLDEKILEIERLRKLVIDQREQGAGYEMNFVINPVHRRINPDNGLAVFIDEIEISMNINGDKNIIPLRFSSVLELTNNSWKVVHLHGSVAVNTEGDTWHKEEHLRKIEELEKLVSEKTEDLLTKNRELEIEASLERVRTVAMGMNKSDDLLNICEVSFKEFKKLGFDNIRNALIHIQYDEQKYFMDYDFSDLTGGAITKIEYGSHPVVEDYLKQIRSAKDAFYQGVIKEDQLEEWKDFRRNSGQIDDPRLDKATALYYYFFSIGIGDIGISTLEPINESQIKILKRFRNVFDLAYRRYTDITRAETQAREAQIEASLERVRAVAMSMNKPDDLLNICEVMFKELQSLRFNKLRNTLISTYQDDKDYFDEYDYSDASGGYITKIPYSSHPTLERFQKQIWRTTDAFAEFIIGEDQLNDWKEHRRSNGEPDDPRLENISALYCYFYSIGPASIGISTFDSISEEMREVLKRFRNVFSLSFQRYTDIALAETQAREAQIELALERVRARTMAMQKSDELKEVVVNMFDGLKSLGVDPTVCNISLMDTKTCDSDVWSAHQTENGLITYRVFISHFEHPFRKKLIDSFLNKISFSVHELSGDLKKSYIQYLIDHVDYSKVPDEVTKSNEKLVNIEEGIVLSAAYMKYGLLIVSRSHAISNDESDILQRFAKIFEQTYTRFLDLQRAEAQAREAQIELALERVRARAMAMQQSDELSETARVLFQQFKELGEDPDQLSIGIVNESEKVIEIWLSLQGNIMNRMFKAPIDEPTVINKIYTAWREKRKSVIIDISGDELERYNRYVNSDVDFKEYNDIKNITVRDEHRRIIYTALFSKGLLSVATQEPRSEETIKILERFAGVFDGTYTRFLDLQKAEAQAREAQIEAALERVRSKAMAMHSSNDLSDTMGVLFTELPKLGINSLRCGVDLLSKSTTRGIFYAAATTQESDTFALIGAGDMNEHPEFMKQYKSWLKNENYFTTLSDDELRSYYEAISTWLSIPYNPREHKLQTEHGYYFSFSEGMFYAWSEKPYAEDEINLLNRFKAIIDLTFRRYLDLKKAEAQAREAQIEAALERVRSRSIGMQKSEELREVIQVIHDQLILLNFEIDAAGFTLDYHQNNDWNTWIANKSESLPSLLFIPYIDHPQFNYYKSAKEKGLDFLANTLSFEEKNSIFNYMFEFMGDYPQAEKDELLGKPGLAISQAFLKNISLWIYNLDAIPYSEEDNSTLMRFAKVFEQTYTRFNDLKQAEAQTREAQIELSLERIRAQVTAMRESSELLDIVVTMRSEFMALGHEAHYFWHMRWLPDKYEKAMTSGDGTRIGMVMSLPRHIHGDIKLVADWEKSDEPSVVLAMDVETAVDYVEKMITLGDFQQVDPQAPTLDDIRHIGGLTFVMARTTHGEIGFSLPGTVPNPPEESVTTLARFAGVFDLAYRRFEDLKEAEEKNKIIQADNERKTKELEDARQLQLSMLPKELPQLPNLDIAVYMKTATEVGGDYYDFNVDANGTLTVLVGDATGHGMMSGMMVSIMKSFFISNKANIELKQFFENSNNSIKDMQLGRLMMGLIGIQITTEKLIATNAGMPSLLYFRNKSQKAGEFVSNNLPLGGMKGTKYLLKAVRYEKGDTLLLMSDGFAELKNSQNEQFGYVRIKEIFRSLVQKSSSGIIEELKTAASQWTNGEEPDDDITFVVIKFK